MGDRCDRIAKLSQRAAREREAGSRPGEGVERSFRKRAKRRRVKKVLKKMKKVLDKAESM